MICFFFFNDTATTEIYTLSLHDALPIYERDEVLKAFRIAEHVRPGVERVPEKSLERLEESAGSTRVGEDVRSEEHTSELQSQSNLVCRLLLEKKTQIHSSRAPRHQHIFP